MLCLGNFVKFIVIYSVLQIYINVDGADSTLVEKGEEIYEIRKKYSAFGRNLTDESIKEIETLLGAASSRWDLYNEISNIMTWWTIDIDKRHDIVFSKFHQVLSSPNEKNALEKLKEEFNEGLEFADKFWRAEMEKKMKNIRENIENLKAQKIESYIFPEHLILSPEFQQIYDAQMENLTSVSSLTKAIIRAYYSNIDPNLAEKNNKTFITYKTKFDMITTEMTSDKTNDIDSKRRMVVERLNNEWKKEEKHEPSQEVFDTEYINFLEYATNVVKNLEKSYNREVENY